MRTLLVFALAAAGALAQSGVPQCIGAGCYWTGTRCASELGGGKCTVGGSAPTPPPSTASRSTSSGPGISNGAGGSGPTLQQQQQAEAQARYQQLQQQLAEQRRQAGQNMDAQARQQFETVQRSIARMESQPLNNKSDFARTCRNGAIDMMPADARDAESVNLITKLCNQVAAQMDDSGSGGGASVNPLLDSQTTDPNATSRGAREALRALDNADALKRDRTLEESVAKSAGPGLKLPDIPITACSPEDVAKLAAARNTLARQTAALQDVEAARADVLKLQGAGSDATLGGYLTGGAQVLSAAADAAISLYDRLIPGSAKPSLKDGYELAKALGETGNALFSGDAPDTGKAFAAGAKALDKILPTSISGLPIEGTGKALEAAVALRDGKTADFVEKSGEFVAKTAEYSGTSKSGAGLVDAAGKLYKIGDAVAKGDPLTAAEGYFGALGSVVKNEALSKDYKAGADIIKAAHTGLEGVDNISEAAGIGQNLNQINSSALSSIERQRSDLKLKIAKTNEEISRLSGCGEIRIP